MKVTPVAMSDYACRQRD